MDSALPAPRHPPGSPVALGPAGIGGQVFWVLFLAALSTALAFCQGDVIVAGLKALYGDPSQAPRAVLENLTLVSPVFPLLLGLVALVGLAWRGSQSDSLFGFQRSTLARDLRLGLVTGFLALGVAVVSLRLLALRFELPPLSLFPWHYHLYFTTVGAVIPGVLEEVYFRGLFFRVAPRLPSTLVLVLSAAAFALWHVETPVYLLHTFVAGLLFGSLYRATGRLAPGIIAHVTANAAFGLLLLAGIKLS